MAKVIMNNEEYVSRLKQIAERKTFYKNKYPFNLLYIHSDGRTSGDCLNTIKALLNGYDVNNTKTGYYQRDLSNTGDVSEPVLLSQCSDISSNFENLIKGELLYMRGHVGTFVGLTQRNGHEFNVIECTKSFGGGVVYSWIDLDGSRRSCKGGVKNGTWISHGKLTKYVSYNAMGHNPVPLPIEPSEEHKVYYVKAGDTLGKIAYEHGMSLAKLLSYNPQIANPDMIYVGNKINLTSGTKEEYYTVKAGDTLSDIAKRYNLKYSVLLGLNPDIQNPDLIHIGDKIRVK